MLRNLLLSAAIVLCVVPVRGQVTTGTILGAVHDVTGASLPGVQVTITESSKGTSQSVTTDSNGEYSVPFLNPGLYRIAVEKQGFKRAISNDVNLQVDEKARLDFTMQIGEITESVEVNASAALVKADSSELGEVVTERAVRDLPLNGRNFAQLVYLVPGVTPGQAGENLSGASTYNPRAASNFNALGSQANTNAWLVDGITDNEYTFNTVMVQPSVESIQEFKVLTGTFSAEFGRGAGVVSTNTKSGSNAYHGTVFEFLRNNDLDARNYFNTSPAQIQPAYRRNQYGASVGGPILKNRLFFFADYYGQREIKGQTFTNSVPTLQEHAGNFSDWVDSRGNLIPIFNPLTTRIVNGVTVRDQFPGNMIPASLINQVGANVVSLFPLPNLPGLQNNLITALSRNLTDNGGNTRIDYRYKEKDSLFGRFSYEKFNLFDTKGQGGCCIPTPAAAAAKFDLGPFVSGGQLTDLTAQGAALNETHVFSATVVNEFLTGYARTNPFTTQSDYGHKSATSLGIMGINVNPFSSGLPVINIGDYTSINSGPAFLPANPKQTSIQVGDTLSWTKGRHQLKFGYRYVRNLVSPFANTNPRSQINFGDNFTNNPAANTGGNGLATLLLGYSTSGTRGFLLSRYYMTNQEHGAFVQDDFKVNQRLTLNLGLRYDLFQPDVAVGNRLANFDYNTLSLVYAGVNGISNTAGIQTRKNDFAPRVGFAYDVFGGGKTVVRGGYGIAYFPEQVSGSNQLGNNLPFVVSQNYNPETYPLAGTVVPTINQPFAPIPPPAQPITSADLNALNPTVLAHGFANQTPSYQSYSLNVEHQFSSSTVAEIGYAGSRGIHLQYGYNPNELQPGSGSQASRRLIPALSNDANITVFDPRNSSNYNSGQAKLSRRFSNGLQFLSSYTYSKSLDYGGSAASGGGAAGNPQTVTNLRAGYGASGFDVKHRYVQSWLYELPFGKGRRYMSDGLLSNVVGGWELDGIATIQTGNPFSVSLANGVNNGATSWPNRIGSGVSSHPDPYQWFDPSAFVAPPPNTYGNAARSVLYGPGLSNVDFSLARDFAVRERLKLKLRVDGFNAFNTPHFGQPNTSINPVAAAGVVGRITSTVVDNRELQVALKIEF